MSLENDLRKVESRINTSSVKTIFFDFEENDFEEKIPYLNIKFDTYTLEITVNNSDDIDHKYEVMFYYDETKHESGTFNNIDEVESYINDQIVKLSI